MICRRRRKSELKQASQSVACLLQYTYVLFYHFSEVRFAYDLYTEPLGLGELTAGVLSCQNIARLFRYGRGGFPAEALDYGRSLIRA